MGLKISSFSNCCGIQIIHNFNNTSAASTIRPSVKETDKALSDIILKGHRSPTLPEDVDLPPVYNYAMQLVALNSHQHKKLHKMMIKKGFKLIDEGWNLIHRNMNYLYSLHLEEGKKTYKLK